MGASVKGAVLVNRLLASSAGSRGRRAAVRLLVAHGHWLSDDLFLETCVESTGHEVWVLWSRLARFVSSARCSTLDRGVLLLAAELSESENIRRFREDLVFRGLDPHTHAQFTAAIGSDLLEEFDASEARRG